MEEQGGGPREMAFVRAAAGCVRPRSGTRQAHGRHPHQKPSSEQSTPHLRYQARFTESQGPCPRNWTLSLTPRGPRDFPEITLPSRSPSHAEAECPGKNYRPGAGMGCRPWIHATWSEFGWAGLTPIDEFSHGESGLWPTWASKSLLWLKLPHPARGGKRWPSGFNSLKSVLKPPKKGVWPLRPQSPRAQKPFSVTESAASCP